MEDKDQVDTILCPRCKTSRAFYSKKLDKWLCFSFTGGPASCYSVGGKKDLKPVLRRRR